MIVVNNFNNNKYYFIENMRLNIAKREVTIFFEKNLKYHKNKFEALRFIASLEGIFASKLIMRRIINR